MNKIETKSRLDNQALGLLPLLLYMLLDNFFNYLYSFIIALTFSFVSLYLYSDLKKRKIHQFLLLVSAVTLVVTSIFLYLPLGKILYPYSSLISEILLVVVLTFVGFTRRFMLRQIRTSSHPLFRRTILRSSLNEFTFISQVVQNLFTLHLFAILVYNVLPLEWHSVGASQFLYNQLGLIIGGTVILYEQVRVSVMKGSLQKEMWLPVLSDEGKVVGCIARSVSRTVKKKYCHPIVRVAVIHDGKLYLTKRSPDSYVAPGTYDYPYENYVLYRHKIENTVRETIGNLNGESGITVRCLIRYMYEDEKVKHQVSLYVVCVRNEKLMPLCSREGGKLWTSKQIEENLSTGIFSGYFEKEFPYLQNTILLAENFCCQRPDSSCEELTEESVEKAQLV